MNIYCIYKATNLINKKVYIGFDSNWPTRKNSHLRCALSGDYPNIAFYNAMRKYGIKNFTWEIIYQSLDSSHTLKVMEPFFIKEYNSYLWAKKSNGYNMTLGGEGNLGMKHSDLTKQKHKEITSRWHKNMSKTEKNQRSVSCSIGQKRRFSTTPESLITKKKKSLSHQGKYLIINPNGEKYIADHGLKEFALATHLDISYWQLFNAYRKCKNNIICKRKRKDENKWIVIRLDKDNQDTRNID